MFQQLLFRLYLYFKGIRFYKTDVIPKSPEFKKAIFETVKNQKVEFFFYREECEDLIFKRGHIRKESFVGYVIQARFAPEMESHEAIYKYNNLKFFFNSKNMMLADEDRICKTLLGIFMDFLISDSKMSVK